MGFFLAPALEQLRSEVNARFPKRDKSSDGWIGDTSHQARPSDHNPCWSCVGRLNGVVRALDVDVDDGDPGRDLRRQLLNAAVGDPRVWYVISNGVIYSRTHGWAARRYTGSNGHFKHVHVSLRPAAGEFDTSRWLEVEAPKIQAKPVDVSVVQEQFRRAIGVADGQPKWSNSVALVQRAIGVTADGIAGPKTVRAWAAYEGRETVPGTGRVRIPDLRSLTVLSKGRFRLKK